uniref:Uncharacterized protein n=1 Tax=Clastoptera arizonana TaxID=38151 RepID=A0A1B6E542_9HEMI
MSVVIVVTAGRQVAPFFGHFRPDFPVEEAVEDGHEESLERSEQLINKEPYEFHPVADANISHGHEDDVMDAEQRDQHHGGLCPLSVPESPSLFANGRPQFQQ